MLDKKKKEALFWRNFFCLVFGFLLQIHAIEHVLFCGILAVPSFLSVTAVLAYVIQKDFTHIADLNLFLKKLAVSIVAVFVLRLFLGVELYTALIFLLVVPISRFVLKNFHLLAAEAHNAKQPLLSTLFKKLSLGFHSLLSLEWIPSMDSIILLSVFFTWTVSALSIFMPGLSLGEILLHDSLLSISVFNLGRWFRSHWVSPELFHNHTQGVYVHRASTGQDEYIKVSDLKKDDVIHITDQLPEGVMIPVRLYTSSTMTTQAIYRDCATEKIRTRSLLDGDSFELESHHRVYKGSFRCQEDYEPIGSKFNKKIKREHELKGEFGTRFFVFLLYLSAFIISLVTSFTAGLVLGLQKLCLLLMVCCPCVYIIIKPAIQGKIPDFAASMDLIMNAVSLPLVNSQITVVFDRTGTLFHEDPKNPEGDYIISKEATEMLKRLIDHGVDIKILSGHGVGENWEKHLKETRNLLSRLGLKNVEENIIFDRDLHGANSAKSTYIKNLKRYNHFRKNMTIRQKLFGSIQSTLFPRTIFMVGDDLNDEGAMAAADIAIAVGSLDIGQIAFNDKIANYAHFVTSKSGIANLHHLIPILLSSSRWVRFLIILSAVIAVMLMALVSGVVNIGLIINPAILCTFTTAYCFFITLFSYSKILDRLIGFSSAVFQEDLSQNSKMQDKKKLTLTFKSICVLVSELLYALWTLFEKNSEYHEEKNNVFDALDDKFSCDCFTEAFPEAATYSPVGQSSRSQIDTEGAKSPSEDYLCAESLFSAESSSGMPPKIPLTATLGPVYGHETGPLPPPNSPSSPNSVSYYDIFHSTQSGMNV